MKMEVGGLYLVKLKSGLAFFGRLEARAHGVCSIGGDWCRFRLGFFCESAIEEIIVPPQPVKNETESAWYGRTGWQPF